MFGFFGRSLLVACLMALLGAPAEAQLPGNERPHCPSATPTNSFFFFGLKDRPEDDKAHLATLAESLVKNPQAVCILALVDPQDGGHSKKLAIRRLIWVKDGLLAKGVSPTLIAAELRPAPAEPDKTALRLVTVILGR